MSNYEKLIRQGGFKRLGDELDRLKRIEALAQTVVLNYGEFGHITDAEILGNLMDALKVPCSKCKEKTGDVYVIKHFHPPCDEVV